MELRRQGIPRATLLDERATSRAEKLKDFAALLAVVAATSLLFGLLFNRESTLSYSIGYNLYGAERALSGEMPYRDFHTLYPPATIYINAALFKVFGVSLYNALVGVMVFKVLTTAMIYLSARQAMPRTWAIGSALLSLLWLRPNGPFKAIPMHYGALFLAASLYFLLKHQRERESWHLPAAGAALGLLALCKHNIGAYALAGSIIFVLLDQQNFRLKLDRKLKNYRGLLWALIGFALPLVAVAVYMTARGAFAPMIETLLFGPGEFLVGRLVAAPSPFLPVGFLLALAVFAGAARRLRSNGTAATAILAAALMLVSVFISRGDESAINQLIFYAPIFVIAAALYACFFSDKISASEKSSLLAVTIPAAAAFMESFPRFAREQAIGAMPFVILLIFYLLFVFKPEAENFFAGTTRSKLALAVVPLAFLLSGSRVFFNTYFDGGFHFKSDTLLSVQRGRGVYFPKSKAGEINEAVAHIEQRVPPGGYFFAQSYAGSSLLFLAERNNPSGAQFWGGVGVSDAERAATLAAVKEKQVSLIVTSEKDLAAEKYAPMRQYISENFKASAVFGDLLILER